MKRYWFAAFFALFCLAAAAVWFGSLNQDEGWYLYAANLVADGKTLYRDFQYTQGPMLPLVYSAFTWVWNAAGVLGARVFTLLPGLASIVFFAASAAKLVKSSVSAVAALVVVFLLGCNLYHLYYLAIPKTYALASLFVSLGFWLFTLAAVRGPQIRRREAFYLFLSGLSVAFAAGTRISLGALLCVVGCTLLFRREWKRLIAFSVGGFAGLALVYGPFLLDPGSLAGLVAAQKYHAARGGFDAVFTIGSLSRLVRWYLPIFIVLGLGVGNPPLRRSVDSPPPTIFLLSFLAVFLVQMLAPFPYEDYQVPVMGLLAVFAAVVFVRSTDSSRRSSVPALLVFGLAYATAFGSPLLQDWMINGQDRFWALKKAKPELAQLREVAGTIEALDPGGRTLLTQDLYLAIETGRRVPDGLEMGPFSMLDDARWWKLLGECECPVAALSGYTFAIDPPRCDERPLEKQMEYWNLLRDRYEFVIREDDFGQNATPLLILKKKTGGGTPEVENDR